MMSQILFIAFAIVTCYNASPSRSWTWFITCLVLLGIFVVLALIMVWKIQKLAFRHAIMQRRIGRLESTLRSLPHQLGFERGNS